MYLMHHLESELSRNMLAAMPEGVEVVDCSLGVPDSYAGPQPSAYPSVVVDVPAYSTETPLIGEDGEFLGMARVTIPAGKEAVRMPASWAVVSEYQAYVAARAAANPPE